MRSLFAGLLFLFAAGVPLIAAESVIMHEDRPSPKLVFNPEWTPTVKSKDGDLARAYIRANWERFGLRPNGANVHLENVEESLAGTHYRFQQRKNGIPVERADIVISISKRDGSVYRVANNTYPVEANPRPLPRILLDREDALDVAWNGLRVYGELLSMPEARMAYIPHDGKLVLGFRVDMSSDGPSGSWSIVVNAFDGEVLSIEDRRVYHGKEEPQRFYRAGDFRYQGMIADPDAAIRRFQERQAEREKQRAKRVAKQQVDGQGLTFDPDPRTTLMDSSLEDFSPDEAFTDAYFTVPLRDIFLDPEDDRYKLLGPWVEIRALDIGGAGPDTLPTETLDGTWNFTRGNNGFNDSMTYYHIDWGQRYIQSLGFTGPTGIQEGPILVDTDGLFNQDNSFFDPSANALVFGHGCVDDNEDADVIHHEYGHAIQDSINSFFTTFIQDGGAIGEGFADYWGGSYSIKTPNGPIFFPEWIYTWDGHGDNDLCWQGRLMNVTDAQYDPNEDYGAHSFHFGYISDELWATPLFQTLLGLYQRGIPQSEVDQLILESHFGFAGALEMPDMAAATIQAARALFPDGPHGDYLQEAFARQNMAEHVSSYEYIAIHVPPGNASWQNEIQLQNPNGLQATVDVTVYENQGGQFVSAQTTQLQIEANNTAIFVPDGADQRWVRFSSDLPLAGVSTFSRDLGEPRGSERAAVPLAANTETGSTIILPHVPGNRVVFWSGMVLVNPNDAAVNLNIELIGDQGNDVSNYLLPGAPTTLGANEKWVSFLAPGPGGIVGIFDDTAFAEKVSWVKITATSEIAGFQLYGYQSGAAATSGILAHPDQNRTHWPIRMGLTNQEWTGFSMVNPSDEAVTLNVRALNAANNVIGEATVVQQPRQKLLGLNQASGFTFPSNGTPVIQIANGQDVRTVIVTSDETTRTFGVPAPLRLFELSGNFSNTELDGAAIFGLAELTAFSNPSGVLQLYKSEFGGDVTVTTRVNGNPTNEVVTLAAGETRELAIPAGAESIEVRGDWFSAAVINQAADGTLTIINGKPVEFSTRGE